MDETKNEVAIQSTELPAQKSKHMLEYEQARDAEQDKAVFEEACKRG